MPNPSGPMACPIDGAALVMSERSGIEIDYCPTCRGVWLDRGELDKIIEKATAELAQQQRPAPAAAPTAAPAQPMPSYGYGHHGGHHGYGHHGSFLRKLFD